jgi:hypothetical protein
MIIGVHDKRHNMRVCHKPVIVCVRNWIGDDGNLFQVDDAAVRRAHGQGGSGICGPVDDAEQSGRSRSGS